MAAGAGEGREGEQRGSRFVDALRNRTFLVLYLAEAQSLVGDQIARVALAILVFERTESAAATALAYACTFLPALLGGAWLARVGDRWSRRTVMVSCDLARAALFGLMAVTGLPLPVLFGLLVLAILIGPAFSAAEVSTISVVLDQSRFRAATGLRMMTNQLAQVGGFAAGGAIVAAIHPHGALLVDAVSYLVSALLVATLVPSTRGGVSESAPRGATRSSWTWLWRRPKIRSLLALGWLAAFFVVPEGLAVPFAARHGGSSTEIGFLVAAIPLGGALGALASVRWIPEPRRAQSAEWMAMLAGVPLVLTVLDPGIAVAAVLWGVSGMFAAYQVETLTALVHRIPDERRATVMGLVAAGLTGAQGIGLIGFGLIAQLTGPAAAVALAGAMGSALALIVVLLGRQLPPGSVVGRDPAMARTVEADAAPVGRPDRRSGQSAPAGEG